MSIGQQPNSGESIDDQSHLVLQVKVKKTSQEWYFYGPDQHMMIFMNFIPGDIVHWSAASHHSV